MGRKSLASKGIVSRDLLYDLYINESLSVKAIAETIRIAEGSVYYYLKMFDIPRRPRGSRRSKEAATPESEAVNGE
jgi:hypothetical protein